MSLRKLVLLGSLAALLGGCVVAPGPHDRRYYDDNYYYSDNDYYDYYSTPSYEGYYYVRVIFIGNIPYYVDDDRRIRPIPPRLYDHFRNSPYRNRDRHVPYFSRDREVRDGYEMSRVVYFNDVPYYVENGRVARPLPNNMHDRFRFAPAPRDSGRPNNDRFAPPNRRDDPPAYGRDFDRREPPAYGREQERMTPPPFERDRADRDNRGNNDPRQYDEPRFRDAPIRDNGNDRFNDRNAREERGNPQFNVRGNDQSRGNDGPRGNDSFRGNDAPRGNDSFRGNDGPRGNDSFRGNDGPRGNDSFRGNDGPRGNDSFRGNAPADNARGRDSAPQNSAPRRQEQRQRPRADQGNQGNGGDDPRRDRGGPFR